LGRYPAGAGRRHNRQIAVGASGKRRFAFKLAADDDERHGLSVSFYFAIRFAYQSNPRRCRARKKLIKLRSYPNGFNQLPKLIGRLGRGHGSGKNSIIAAKINSGKYRQNKINLRL